MNHALACISFTPVSTLQRKIESITIKNVYRTADLKMSGIPNGVKYPEIKWENYRDKTIGFYYYDIDGTLINTVRNLPDVDNAGIVEAGYMGCCIMDMLPLN